MACGLVCSKSTRRPGGAGRRGIGYGGARGGPCASAASAPRALREVEGGAKPRPPAHTRETTHALGHLPDVLGDDPTHPTMPDPLTAPVLESGAAPPVSGASSVGFPPRGLVTRPGPDPYGQDELPKPPRRPYAPFRPYFTGGRADP